MPRRQVCRSRPRGGAILWLVRRTFFFFWLPPSPRTHNAGARVRACARSVFVVRRRECVPDFCRDATHVYPRTPARATARRPNPRSRKGRPRSCAAREQYVPCHTYHSLPRWQSLFFVNVFYPLLDLSDKNPLVELPHDASVIALLAVFSTGTHRGTSSSAQSKRLHTYHVLQCSSRRRPGPPSRTWA